MSHNPLDALLNPPIGPLDGTSVGPWKECVYKHPDAPNSDDTKDAERFRYLQNLKPIEAQQFFWNHVSRKQRVKAIDEHMRQGATGGSVE